MIPRFYFPHCADELHILMPLWDVAPRKVDYVLDLRAIC